MSQTETYYVIRTVSDPPLFFHKDDEDGRSSIFTLDVRYAERCGNLTTAEVLISDCIVRDFPEMKNKLIATKVTTTYEF